MPDVAVRYSSYFEDQLAAVKENAKRGPLYKAIDHVIGVALNDLSDSAEAFATHRALGRRKHDFTGIWRFKGKTKAPWERGVRVFYIGNQETKRVVVLEYGERCPGEPDDAYEEFAKRLVRGYFDPYFIKLDLRHAYCKVPPAPQPLRSSQRT